MPVRSLHSSVLKWPDARAVDEAARHWARRAAQLRRDVVQIGYFGSYARGDWGVGSDLDLIIIVDRSDLPFERRAADWNATGLPVPADVLVYTQEEWQSLDRRARFHQMLQREAIWVYVAGNDSVV